MKFLIVDDDPAILKITQKLVELQGHEVVCCENAYDAIHALSGLSFDILITDATMPFHSGFDLIRSIRKRKELSYLTITMLTGRSEKKDIELALQLGVQDYIVKPIEPEVFLEKVDKLVDIHSKKQLQKPAARETNADMIVPVHVLRITDVGVTIESPYPLTKGTVVQLHLNELKDIGIMKNKFKALFNSTQGPTARITTELLLLDISPGEQEKMAKLAKKWNDPIAA